MSYRRLEIHGLHECHCGHHSWLLMRVVDGPSVRLRVTNGLSTWFDEEGDAADSADRIFGSFAAVIGQLGEELIAVIVDSDDDRPRVSLRLISGERHVDVVCDPDLAMLAAKRIGLPVFLAVDGSGSHHMPEDHRDPVEHTTTVPEVFHEALESLGLGHGD